MSAIRSASVKKVLSELKALSESNKEKYTQFIEQYNKLLKEGLYSDWANRETLTDLIRFKSTAVEGYTSFKEYTERMKEGQKAIYFITGGKESALKNSPLIEAYKAKGFEVLIMDDNIDEIVIPSLGKYKDFELKSVNRKGAADDLKDKEDEKKAEEIKPLLEKIKEALGDKVKSVIASSRLSDSPSCIVADENDPTMQMQALLKSIGQGETEYAPVLEINPGHPIVQKLAKIEDKDVIEDISFVLLEQARLAEGAPLADAAGFIKRLNKLTEKAL